MADNRYRITERVAAGGMAEVFRGVAESMRGFKKNIAIKRILPALTKNKKFVAMFLDEARLSLSLQHANIVQVFDIGHTEDTYFIVMEYVDGVDLKAILDWRRRVTKRIPVAHSLYIITEICKGLSYAHELPNPETEAPMGIVHRDVSPPNVLLSKQGEVKVVDFGLAKATSQVEVTDPGVVKGKMSYLSPEAARGEEVDSRADIFAVGILLYEMLTGKRLFYGETDYQTVELVRNAKVPPLRPQNPQVEPELEDIVRKALSKRKEDRFQSATDLQDALAQYSYSRGLKVISRDIAELVRQCLDDKRMQSGEGKKASIIDHLLQGDLDKFTSVGFEEDGAQPLQAGDLGQRPEPPPVASDGDFVDPRGWADERLAPGMDAAEARALEARRTSRDAPASVVPAPAAQRRPERMRVPTGENRAPRNSPPAASPVESTPGPEALASVLEPTPGPQAQLSSRPGAPAARTVQAPSHAGRSFLIGALIGLVLLGAAVAVFVSKHGGLGGASHATQPAS
ncbi:MAG TPA: protein kinase [Polyangia bacterium]|jgi:serine/threonine-protein kinase|nr:protein kinase [Polyangia bacterium]